MASYFSIQSNQPCFICWESSEDSIAHEGGHAHPACRKCIEIWQRFHDTCPLCREPVQLLEEVMLGYGSGCMIIDYQPSRRETMSCLILCAISFVSSFIILPVSLLNRR